MRISQVVHYDGHVRADGNLRIATCGSQVCSLGRPAPSTNLGMFFGAGAPTRAYWHAYLVNTLLHIVCEDGLQVDDVGERLGHCTTYMCMRFTVVLG